ncbi:hypothetical protein KSP39_PZI017794 [Platanthera zijinensis]|uniref:Uncharacterized protein n=1 Tax=Platanthera zijinensis TaxID=2320716 RepID=A0AAP0B5Y5_9ASPA
MSHGPYGLGHTRATMAMTMRSNAVRRSESGKTASVIQVPQISLSCPSIGSCGPTPPLGINVDSAKKHREHHVLTLSNGLGKETYWIIALKGVPYRAPSLGGFPLFTMIFLRDSDVLSIPVELQRFFLVMVEEFLSMRVRYARGVRAFFPPKTTPSFFE